LGNAGKETKLLEAGHNKAARLIVRINDFLKKGKQLRRPLDFVENSSFTIFFQKTARIFLRQFSNVGILQGNI